MINTVALKTTIIDLAVSGKVSSQFHASDSVSDIIEALPEVSSKRKKLLGQSFEYGSQNAIPSHWAWICLGEIASYGDSPAKANYDDVSSDTWILDLEDIKSGGEIITKTRVREKKFIGEKTIFKKGQVLYSKLRPYLKKVLVADEDGISTPELVSFEIFGGVLPQYIVYCLLSSFTDRAIDKRSYGIKMPRVDAGFMVNLPIPLPPVSEQHFIVNQVQTAFSLIDTIEELQAQYADNLFVLKSKLIDAAIQGKLTEQLPEDGTAEELYQQIQTEKQKLIKEGKIKKAKPLPEIAEDDIPFDIPDNWKWIKHNSIFEIIGGSQPPKSFFVDTPRKGYVRLYQIRDYGSKPSPVYVPIEKVTKFTVKDDILLARYGGSLGKVFLAENGAYNVAMAKIAFLFESNLIYKRFLFYYYLSSLYQNFLKRKSRAAQDGFNKKDLDELLFPLPPLAEQKRIVQKLDEIPPLCDNMK